MSDCCPKCKLPRFPEGKLTPLDELHVAPDGVFKGPEGPFCDQTDDDSCLRRQLDILRGMYYNLSTKYLQQAEQIAGLEAENASWRKTWAVQNGHMTRMRKVIAELKKGSGASAAGKDDEVDT